MKQIQVKNFKCYSKPTSISLSNITINVGMNSVGKSTLIQSLLLLRIIYDEMVKYKDTSKTIFRIPLNGPYGILLGHYNQTISNGSECTQIQLDNSVFVLERGNDEFSLSYINDKGVDSLPSLPLFSEHFYYLNAERLGPRNYQSINEQTDSLCGWHGETTFDAIEKNLNSIVDEKRRRTGESFPVSILSKQIEYWMNYVTPGIEFSTSKDIDTQTTKLKMRQTTLDTDFISPYNFGFGISYTLPIIVTGLLAEPGSTFIVENPEAHLHPSGQSRIGSFLAQVATSGVSVIIETHSEHVVNGIRVYSLKNRVDPQRICINYFSIIGTQPSVTKIELNQQMDILQWPDGFFDQEEKDLSELRHLRRKQ